MSPRGLEGGEVYLASELDRLVVDGEVAGFESGDLGREFVTGVGLQLEPKGCAPLVGGEVLRPAGYRSRTGPGFESELFLLSSVTAAEDRFGDLLGSSGRCSRVESRSEDGSLAATTIWSEAAVEGSISSGADGTAVHWLAGVAADEIGSATIVVAASTGNLLQTFRTASTTLSAPAVAVELGHAISQRLGESALAALQERADDAMAFGYSSGAPVPPSPAPTSRFALGPVGSPETLAAPLSDDFFASAPVPALCWFDAGTLVDGVLPGIAEADGGVYLRDEGPAVASPVAVDPSPSLASAAGAAVVGCNHGGVSWPDSLVLYSAEGSVLDAIGVADIVPGGYRDWITGVVFDGDAYQVTWAWEDADGSAATRPVSASLRWDGLRTVVSDVVIGDRYTS
ncbi:hypothetical protein [Rathayibacter festucae]|uniref:hypothetical protein n=1 Tax=Rathayibacter festucae TaxID=110937 RepID=UPI000FDBA4D9|nr:hypothetical protein [Rathayibacter festucae]